MTKRIEAKAKRIAALSAIIAKGKRKGAFRNA